MGKGRILFKPFFTLSTPGDLRAGGETLGRDHWPLEEGLVTKCQQSTSTPSPSNLKINTFFLAFTVSHREFMDIYVHGLNMPLSGIERRGRAKR